VLGRIAMVSPAEASAYQTQSRAPSRADRFTTNDAPIDPRKFKGGKVPRWVLRHCTTSGHQAPFKAELDAGGAQNDGCCATGTIGMADELNSSCAVCAKCRRSRMRKACRNVLLARPTRVLRLP